VTELYQKLFRQLDDARDLYDDAEWAADPAAQKAALAAILRIAAEIDAALAAETDRDNRAVLQHARASGRR
jgi:hypothetical protein